MKPIDQLRADLLLYASYLVADRGLGEAEFPAGGGDAAEPPDGFEYPQPAQIEFPFCH